MKRIKIYSSFNEYFMDITKAIKKDARKQKNKPDELFTKLINDSKK